MSNKPWFHYCISDLQAILGLSQLKRLEQIVFERNLQLQYRKLIAHLPVEFLAVPEHVLSSVHLAVIRLKIHT